MAARYVKIFSSTNTLHMISILIPCRNAVLYLTDCLDSIGRQSYSKWECIVVDDHSEDDSKAVVQGYVEKDSRFMSIDNEGTGIIDALRTAYARSSGMYITRMDADDIMADDKIEQLHRTCAPGKVAVGQVSYFATGKTLGEGYQRYATWLNKTMTSADPWRQVYRECIVPSPAWMLHRADLDQVGAFDTDCYPEDYDLCLRMYDAGLQISPTASIVHEWRDYDTRTSRTDEHYSDNRFLEIKVDSFLKIDHDPAGQLVLWGAGGKGKAIAQLLRARDISFTWITNNTKKIGKDIYGQRLQATTDAPLREQVIIAVANRQEQQEITEVLERRSIDSPKHWFFC